MRLETERLIIRELVEHDWRPLLGIEQQPKVVRYMTQEPQTEPSIRAYVERGMLAARDVPRLVFDFAITERGDDTLIGRVGMRRTESEPQMAMLWFLVDPRLAGRGYATEAARALLAYAFDEVGLHRVWGDCDPRNPASGRVMEKVGMRREGHLVENAWIKGEWCDSVLYAILAREWRGRNPCRSRVT